MQVDALREGNRVVLNRKIRSLESGVFRKGDAGTIVHADWHSEVGWPVAWVHMDDHHPSLDAWNNQLAVHRKQDLCGDPTLEHLDLIPDENVAAPADLSSPKAREDTPPILFFRSGETFFEAGKFLQIALDGGDLNVPQPHVPATYLFMHAMELTMKAFLRSKGLSDNVLKSPKFSHNLQTLWDECLWQKLHPDLPAEAFIGGLINLLNPLALDHALRYVRVGTMRYPAPDEMIEHIGVLRDLVSPHVHDTITKAAPPAQTATHTPPVPSA